MRHLTLVALSALLVACSGSEPQRSPDDPTPDEPAPPTDPMVAACDAGTAKSCLMAGENAERGGDPKTAARLWAKACELEEASGCALAGGTLANRGDVERGVALLERGCELDEPTSCYGAALARMGMFGGDSEPGTAAGLFERGCALGLADACGALAGLLESGSGVEKDPERAESLREQACNGGDAASCVALASGAFETGDLQRGATLLEKACESDGSACTRRGLVALQKEQNPDTARTYFQRGCTAELADADGCGWMGWLVHEGLGGSAEPERGRALIDDACEAGSATGCMFGAVASERDGASEQAEAAMKQACELAPEQCPALRTQYEKLTGK